MRKQKVSYMNYTDINKTYQIILSKNGAEVIDDNFQKYTTRIKTPISVWMDIAKGVIDGKQAVIQHMYTVSGDFELMINWDEIFGLDSINNEKNKNHNLNSDNNNSDKKTPKTNMNFMLIPFTAYYSMNDFGEEKGLENPLFLRTNRIRTPAWGILYLITPIWTYFLMNTKVAYTTGIINSILPVFLGIFTKWFVGWYPPYYLSEKN